MFLNTQRKPNVIYYRTHVHGSLSLSLFLSLSPIFSSTNASVIYQPEVSIEATDYYRLVMNIYSNSRLWLANRFHLTIILPCRSYFCIAVFLEKKRTNERDEDDSFTERESIVTIYSFPRIPMAGLMGFVNQLADFHRSTLAHSLLRDEGKVEIELLLIEYSLLFHRVVALKLGNRFQIRKLPIEVSLLSSPFPRMEWKRRE